VERKSSEVSNFSPKIDPKVTLPPLSIVEEPQVPSSSGAVSDDVLSLAKGPSLESIADSKKTEAKSDKKTDKIISNDRETTWRDLVTVGWRLIREVATVSPGWLALRATSTVATVATAMCALNATGHVIELIAKHQGSSLGTTTGLLAWSGIAIVSGFGASVLKKVQDLVSLNHDQKIELKTVHDIFSVSASLPPHLLNTREVSDDLTILRRNEYFISTVSKELFTFAQFCVTCALAAAPILYRFPLEGVASLFLPVILFGISFGRQAQRNEAREKETTELQKLNNYWRVTALNPVGLISLFVLGKSEHFISKHFENYKTILNHKKKGEVKNFLDKVVSGSVADLATYGTWGIFVLYSLSFMSLREFSFLAGSLLYARSSLESLAQSFGSINQRVRFVRTLYRLKDLVREHSDSRPRLLLETPPDIHLKDVTFRYPNTEKVALSIKELHIPSGSRVVVIGDNGAGKTTLMNLLCGAELPTTGSVNIGGFDTKSVVPYVALISQKQDDFKGWTVKEVIEFGAVNGQSRDLDEVIRLARLDEVLSKKKLGVNSRIDASFKDGTGFSGGERQLISLAQSFASPAKLKIRDEALSALSPPNAIALVDAIESERTHATLIDVTHHLAYAVHADKVLVLKNGEIVEEGDHAQLMERNGWYAKYYREQASAYKEDTNKVRGE
jgi:ATP-binding cassette, subfamily B, bacterial